MRKQITSVLLTALLLGALTGCADSSSTLSGGASDPGDSGEESSLFAPVVVADNSSDNGARILVTQVGEREMLVEFTFPRDSTVEDNLLLAFQAIPSLRDQYDGKMGSIGFFFREYGQAEDTLPVITTSLVDVGSGLQLMDVPDVLVDGMLFNDSRYEEAYMALQESN